MQAIRKILLGGDIGKGEASLLLRLMKEIRLPLAGLRTLMYPDQIDPETGGAKIYLYPINTSPDTYPDSEENYVGSCTGRDRKINTEVFLQLGLQQLSDVPEGAAIIIDEIGFFEEDVAEYTDRIFALLDDPDHPVLAVVKTRYECPFLTKVKTYPGTSFYQVTEENREELFETLSAAIRQWNNPKV